MIRAAQFIPFLFFSTLCGPLFLTALGRDVSHHTTCPLLIRLPFSTGVIVHFKIRLDPMSSQAIKQCIYFIKWSSHGKLSFVKSCIPITTSCSPTTESSSSSIASQCNLHRWPKNLAVVVPVEWNSMPGGKICKYSRPLKAVSRWQTSVQGLKVKGKKITAKSPLPPLSKNNYAALSVSGSSTAGTLGKLLKATMVPLPFENEWWKCTNSNGQITTQTCLTREFDLLSGHQWQQHGHQFSHQIH